EELAAAMAALPGIGPWTAQYVALRALGEPDALPTGDLVLRRMAAPPGRGSLTTRELDERSREWRPWRGYAVVHVLGAAARLSRRRSRSSVNTSAACAGSSRCPWPRWALGSSSRSGRPSAPSRTVRRFPMLSSRGASAGQGARAPWDWRTGRTHCRSSSPAIG